MEGRMLQWRTHFYKKDTHQWKLTPSVQMSTVLAVLPEGELWTTDRIVRETLALKDNKTLRKDSEVRQTLQDLVKEGFVGEVFSEKIYRFIKTLN